MGWSQEELAGRVGIHAQAVAYWHCNGDRDAMTEWLMRSTFAYIDEQSRNTPPLVLDGETYPLNEVVREMVRLRALEIAALIEGHGQPRH